MSLAGGGDPVEHADVEPGKPPDRETNQPTSPAGGADLTALRDFHRETDSRARELAGRLGDRLQCRRGCASCCLDGLTVLPLEAERIRTNHADLLRDGVPHPAGGCAFLDAEGSCRVYSDRPYVCRTQGLPLRWFEAASEGDDAQPSVVEHRDICPLNDSGPPLAELSDEDCWLLGPAEAELAKLAEAAACDGESAPLERVALRSLFRDAG
jgi:hypothetical protein